MKDKTKSWIIVIICLLLLAFPLLFIHSKPHYKIEKEVCWNQTHRFELVFTEYPDNQVDVENKDIAKFIGCRTGDGFDNKWFCEFERIEQVCEQQEVDEIKIKGKPSCNGLACGGGLEIIPKEDLTKEWLDENAECIECYYPKNLFDKPYGSYWRNSEMEGFDKSCNEDKNGICSKYQVGDYEVIVN